MEATQARTLIIYPKVMTLTGLPKRTLVRRIEQARVPLHIDGRDRRRWLIRVETVERGAENAA